MMQVRWLGVVCALTVLGACAPKPVAHDTAADVAAISKVRDGYAAAFKAGDAAGVAALIAPDAHNMENTRPTAIGPQGVEASLKAAMDQVTSPDITITSEKLDVSGDMAYDRGTVRTSLTPKAGGAPMVEEGRYLVVLKRQADSSWKLVELMGNSPTPPAPAPPPAKK